MVANIWVAAADNNIELVNNYLDSGNYTPNSRDPNGYTPVHAAASYGNIELLELLLKHGGDINVQDNEGDTPLHHCEELKVVRYLVETLQANWKIKNHEDHDPEQELEDEYPEIADYLKQLKNDPTGKSYVQRNKDELSNVRVTLEDPDLLGQMDGTKIPEEDLRQLVEQSVHELKQQGALKKRRH